jgi:aspartate carbamoyltransferase catalytic subunit
VKHLLSIADLAAKDLHRLLDLTDHMVEISHRPIPKVPALRGKNVVSLFFEDSTRTRTSFDTAAKRLSADTMNFAVSSSSVNKGESLRDTIETISAMGVDAFVVRHKSSGTPLQITQWTTATVGTNTRRRRCSTATRSAPHSTAATASTDCASRSSATSSTAA